MKWEPLTPALKRKLGWEEGRTTHRARLQQVVVWYAKNTVIGFEVEGLSQDGPSPEFVNGGGKTGK